jgi:DNA-binding GntR family transcriptional regulator
MTEAAGSRVASQRVAEVLRERILSGRLRPGTRIKQDELAEELDTSRIPVREALRILETRGLVEVRSNSGAWVGQMDLHDLTMSYQIRERIEPLLLADSMPRLGDDDVAALRDLQARIEANDDLETFMVLDRELHWRTYAGHRTPQLASMVERLWDTTQHYRREFARLMGARGAWAVNAEHRLLVDAIAAHDEDTACRVLALHVQRTRTELMRHPEVFTASTAHP